MASQQAYRRLVYFRRQCFLHAAIQESNALALVGTLNVFGWEGLRLIRSGWPVNGLKAEAHQGTNTTGQELTKQCRATRQDDSGAK
mgnify:CR=1 FL=1